MVALPEFSAGIAGGVPGGVPCGQLGGVLGGIIVGVDSSSREPTHFVEPPPPAAAKAPIRVGGKVSPPRQVHFQQSYYPPLARQARIQGDVKIDAIIDTDDRVVDAKVISGHPLWVEEALKAVGQWRYQPALLNGEPRVVQFVFQKFTSDTLVQILPLRSSVAGFEIRRAYVRNIPAACVGRSPRNGAMLPEMAGAIPAQYYVATRHGKWS